MTEPDIEATEPEDAGCPDDTAREVELHGPLDEPDHEDIEVEPTE